MPTRDIASAEASDMVNAVDDVTVDAKSVDSPSQQKETTYMNTNWTQYWGYFNAIPELHSAILMKSIWTCGKGYTTQDNRTKVVLDHITGWGKDSFHDILFNMDVIKNINGDSFAEIIRDPESRELMNLKPLNPGTIKIVVNDKGIIKRYEQVTRPGIKATPKTWKPENIFHLSNNRLGDQIHGISIIEAMESTIKAMNESFVDMKKVMHYQGRPYIIWKLKTDDTTKIGAFKDKIDAARNLGEDMFIPDDDDAVEHEIVQINPSAFILEWQRDLGNRFYRAVGMPLVLFGQAGQTESGGKIEYLGHEQVFEHNQKYIEEQVWKQLYKRIDLIPPQSLLPNIQTDQAKDAQQGMEVQPSDVTPGAG